MTLTSVTCKLATVEYRAQKRFFSLHIVFISVVFKSFSPAATLDPRPRLWTRDRDIGPATATLDPRPRPWTRDRDIRPATATLDPRPATRDPRLLVKLGVVCFRSLALRAHSRATRSKARLVSKSFRSLALRARSLALHARTSALRALKSSILIRVLSIFLTAHS